MTIRTSCQKGSNTTQTSSSLRGSAITSEILKLLIETGKERRVITYGELSTEINRKLGKNVVPERGRGLGRAVGELLHPICNEFYTRFSVLPGSVVVSKRTRMPSEGYFRFLESLGFEVKERRALWRTLLEDFYRFCEVNIGSNWVLNPLSDSNFIGLSPHLKEGKDFKGNGSRG